MSTIEKNYFHNKAIYDKSLFYGVLENCVGTVKDLIKKGADVNFKNRFGHSALHTAAAYGYTKIAKLLIESGADLNAQTNYNETALHHAVNNNDFEFAKLLIKKGADLNIQNKKGCTPLDLAVLWGYTKIEKFLQVSEKTILETA
jgi:cytohesin